MILTEQAHQQQTSSRIHHIHVTLICIYHTTQSGMTHTVNYRQLLCLTLMTRLVTALMPKTLLFYCYWSEIDLILRNFFCFSWQGEICLPPESTSAAEQLQLLRVGSILLEGNWQARPACRRPPAQYHEIQAACWPRRTATTRAA